MPAILKVALFLLAATEFCSLSAGVATPAAENFFPTTNKTPNFVQGLVNLDFSDYYLTPRGINLQDKGLIFQSLVRLDWNLYNSRLMTNQAINGATLTIAVRNDVDTSQSGVAPGNWNEIDFIAGPNFRFLNDWTFESPFTAFKSQTDSFPTCWAGTAG